MFNLATEPRNHVQRIVMRSVSWFKLVKRMADARPKLRRSCCRSFSDMSSDGASAAAARTEGAEVTEPLGTPADAEQPFVDAASVAAEDTLFDGASVAAGDSERASGTTATTDSLSDCDSENTTQDICTVCRFEKGNDEIQWLACGHWLHQSCANGALGVLMQRNSSATMDDFPCYLCRRTAHDIRTDAEELVDGDSGIEAELEGSESESVGGDSVEIVSPAREPDAKPKGKAKTQKDKENTARRGRSAREVPRLKKVGRGNQRLPEVIQNVTE